MKKVFSLRALFQQGGPGSGHHGHRGRKGQEGGSLPGSGGGSLRKGSSSGGNWSEPKLPSDRGYSARDTSIEDAMEGFEDELEGAISFERRLPKKLGNLTNPKTVAELKTGLKSLKGSGDLRNQAKEALTGSGWKYILRSELSGADVYGKGPFRVEVYFGRNKTQVQFRKTGNSWQSV